MTSGDKVGVFCCQNGPGTENAFGGIAQAYAESVPLVVMPGGTARGQPVREARTSTRSLNFQHITKSAETVTTPGASGTGAAPRVHAWRATAAPARAARDPGDVWTEEVPGTSTTSPREARASARPDPRRRRRSRRRADRGRAPADLRRAGRALRPGVGRAQGRSPSCSRSR